MVDVPSTGRRPKIPGYGTFPWPFAKSGYDYQEVARGAQRAIETALTLGYRHLDTAFTYRNQDQVGAAIRAAGILREEIYLTSKLHHNNNNYREAREKIREAIKLIWGKQASDSNAYLNAFLLHYPGVGRPLGAWKALQEARQEGLVRHIGVSNFEIWHIEKLKKGAGEYPEINQIEFHPWIYPEQAKLLEYCHAKGIAVEGYSPLAQGQALMDPVIVKLAAVHKTTPARVVLKWCMQHGVKPIFGSRNLEHLRTNAESYIFTLSADDMQVLDGLGVSHPIRVAEQWHWNPKTAPFGGPVPGLSWRSRLRRMWIGWRV